VLWTEVNTNGGEIVASQTTNGDFKDVKIIARFNDGDITKYALVSLLDGGTAQNKSKAELVAWLNGHSFVPVAKMLGRGSLPENRALVPAVQVFGLRGTPISDDGVP
jgi:hypothetical protein